MINSITPFELLIDSNADIPVLAIKKKGHEKIYLLNAASGSSRTAPRSLWTAMQSLSFHSLTGPSAPFLLVKIKQGKID
jgi:hypothetical protein